MSESTNTTPAGEGLTDDEMVRQVAGQTSSDLKHADVFERESDGAKSDVEAAKASPSHVEGSQ